MYERLLEKLGITEKITTEFEVPQYIRVNTLKISDSELIKRLAKKNITLKKVSYLKNGYEVMGKDFSLVSTEEYLMGFFYMQDAASQVPAEVLNPVSTDVVLDMCSAPGSKTTHLAQIMENRGQIIALDVKEDRLGVLRSNIERLGISNVVIYNKDGIFVKDVLPKNFLFDKILLDAPCSGNYALKDYQLRTEDDLAKKSVVQKRLIKAASAVLKKGGILVYSTCSIETKENEEVIEWALENCGLSLVPISLEVTSGLLKETKRFFPHVDRTSGFFVAKLEKV